MNNFIDASIFIAFLNFASMVGNVWFSFKLKETQANKELITYWQNKSKELEDKLLTLKDKKDNLKLQYTQLITEHKQLKGELRTYKQFHKHDID